MKLLCRYSILISDTVKVGQEKAVCLTEGTKATDEVTFFFQVRLPISVPFLRIFIYYYI